MLDVGSPRPPPPLPPRRVRALSPFTRNALDTGLPSRYTTQMHMAILAFPPSNRCAPPFSIHPSYTTGENSVSYNQQLGVATHIP
jgi:hypothetical protein